VVATVGLFPGSILTLGAGYIYGVVWGTILISVASTTGAALAFVLGRYVARDWVRRFIDRYPMIRALDSALEREAFEVVFLLRLVPLVPFNALNYALGLTKIPLGRYVLASWIGMIPGTIMYNYFGSLAKKMTQLAAGVSTDRVPVWDVATTVQQLLAGDTNGGVLQNVFYWLGFVAAVGVAVVLTRAAKAELERLTEQGDGDGESTLPRESDVEPGEQPELEPRDNEHNRRLERDVFPPDRVNPEPEGPYNLVAVGGGTAGLVGAAGAAGLGAKSALIERHLLGGDCLNSGCVPSKALISAANRAHDVREADDFGVRVDGEVRVDFGAVMERMRRLRADIGEEDSVERFESLGVDVYQGNATFVNE
ncbi:MAG: VTT domain-containing protein, partial [Bradymonadaceae bacterium]